MLGMKNSLYFSLEDSNENSIDFLRLDDQLLLSSSLTELLRAILLNETVKHVSIEATFLDAVTEEKAHVILEMVGNLPKLESLSIRFSDHMKTSTKTALLYSTIHKASLLKKLEICGLNIKTEKEAKKTSKGFKYLFCLEKLKLLDFSISSDIAAGKLIQSRCFWPQLEKMEIRLKQKGKIPGAFLDSLCELESLRSLVLWNVQLNSPQVVRFCEFLQINHSIQQLELWRCELGEIFSSLLKYVIQMNTTIETFVIADIIIEEKHLHEFLKRLKENKSIKKLILIGVGSSSKINNQEVIELMKSNENLRSIKFHGDEVNEKTCIILNSSLEQNNAFFEELNKERKRKNPCSGIIKEPLRQIFRKQ